MDYWRTRVFKQIVMVKLSLENYNDKELLRLYCDLMEELRQRNLIR
jgi:hypothetical protein